MDRINGAGHVGHLFVAEDVALNRPPTEITPEWMNGVQEELASFIERYGIVLDVADNTQLAKGFGKAIAAGQRSINVIVNGAFDVWQLGTAVTIPASTAYSYTADQWILMTGANQAHTVSQQAGLGKSRSAGRVQRNAGQTGTGSMAFEQPFVLDDFAHLRGAASKLSFRIKAGANFSPAGGVMTAYLYTGTGTESRRGSGGIFAGEVAQLAGAVVASAAETLFVFDVPALPAGVTQASFQLTWAPVGAAGAADYFDIGEVQWELGTERTEFERLKKSDVIRHCQTFLEKSFPLDTAPAQNTGSAVGAFFFQANATTQYNHLDFKVTKRVIPAITLYNPAAANSNVRDYSASADRTAQVGTPSIYGIRSIGASGCVVTNSNFVHWLADSRL